MARELRATRVNVELHLLPGLSCIDIIAKFTRLLRGDDKVVDRVDQIIREPAVVGYRGFRRSYAMRCHKK